jgi:hypothetical protein
MSQHCHDTPSHVAYTKAICDEIADIKRQKVSEFKKLTKEERRESLSAQVYQ